MVLIVALVLKSQRDESVEYLSEMSKADKKSSIGRSFFEFVKERVLEKFGG